MTAHDGFTPRLETWLTEEGVELTPDYLGDVLARTTSTRQRPAWASLERWLPVTTTLDRARAVNIPPAARYVLIAALIALVALAGLVIYAGQRHRVPAPFGPAANGRIFFDRAGTIYSANAQGGDLKALDLPSKNAASPFLSPDGTRFSFVVTDPSNAANSSLWVADADGSHARNLTSGVTLSIDAAYDPTWSPDGTQVAFGAFFDLKDALLIASADGSGVRALDGLVVDGTTHHWYNPEWSPSGEWIAFQDEVLFADHAVPQDDNALAVIHPDGTGYHRLPTSMLAGAGFHGTQAGLWAPDLTNRVLYALGATSGGLDDLSNGFEGSKIAWMDVDTGKETIVAEHPTLEVHRPAWSPDGTRIAFHLGDSMALVNPDRSNLTVLNDRLSPKQTAWSPDGAWVFGYNDDETTFKAIDPQGAKPPFTIDLGGTPGFLQWQRVAP